MSEPESVGWDQSFSEAWWRETRSSGGGSRRPENVDRLADHLDVFWGDPRPDPEPDVPRKLLEAVWGPQAAPESGGGEETSASDPEQLSLFDLPAAGADPAAPARD